MHTIKIPAQKTGNFSMQQITVTWKKDHTNLEQLLGNDFPHFASLHELVQKTPRSAKRSIRALHEKYPDIPEVSLLYAYALIACRRLKKATLLLQENYQKNPGHLLSKINYADQCLRKKDLSTLQSIFDNKTDLKEIYPNKRAFHISEYRGFMTLMGHYHLYKNMREEAMCYHYLAAKLDPNHPSTALLGRKLYPRPRIFRRNNSK